MEYCSAIKRTKSLAQATTWINFENIMLSEIIQTQKDIHCKFPLMRYLIGQIHNGEWWLPRAWGEEKWQANFGLMVEFILGSMKMFWG